MDHSEIKKQYIEDIRLMMLANNRSIKAACRELDIPYTYFMQISAGSASPKYEWIYDTLIKLGKGTRISHYNIKEDNNG